LRFCFLGSTTVQKLTVMVLKKMVLNRYMGKSTHGSTHGTQEEELKILVSAAFPIQLFYIVITLHNIAVFTVF